MVADLRALGRIFGRVPSIEESLDYLGASLDELLARGSWNRMLAEAGLREPVIDPDAQRLAIGVRKVARAECLDQIREWLSLLADMDAAKGTTNRISEMFHVSLWGEQSKGWTTAEAVGRLRANPASCEDLRAVLEYRLRHAPTHHAGRIPHLSGPLTIHAPYHLDEILVGLGHSTLQSRPSFREGVLWIPHAKVDAFFVTLQKSDEDYSPTTMYEDYLISPNLFHWQSQSSTSVDSPTGKRYLRHKEEGYTPLLFVRESTPKSGPAAPYYFLGPCSYVSHKGSRPISIVWRLAHAVPARLLRSLAQQKVG